MICNVKPNQTNYYIPEKTNINDIVVDQAVLTKEEYLSKIPYVDYTKAPEEYQCYDDVYPYVNSYYCHTEDCDPLSKVNSLLAQPELLENCMKEDRDSQQRNLYQAYSERAAQVQYLESRPVSFIILGKPDIGQQELGKQIADFWNCVYIDPQNLIEEEIKAGSRAGECIEFNLKCGRAISMDIILKLVEQRVKSETSKHQGFVLSGFPIITNDLYEDDPISSQSAVFTARDIFDEIFIRSTDIFVPPSNPQVSVSSKYQSDAEGSIMLAREVDSGPETATHSLIDVGESPTVVNFAKAYEKQLEFLFSLLGNPYFIIYIQCGALDVLNKRDNYRYDFTANEFLSKFRFIPSEPNYIDVSDELFHPAVIGNRDFRIRHLVKLPQDFKANVSSQLDNYHYRALNFIQNTVLVHHNEYFIKVDGRTSVFKMLSIIKAKLKVMNVQPVLIPNRFIDNDVQLFVKTQNILMEEDVETIHNEEEEEDNLTPQGCFKQLRKQLTPSKSHLWSWSEWGAKCPVSMKLGYLREGSVKYAVQFMNKIFFLADQDAYNKFYMNPRPFLLPPFPRPTCRIFIFGPKRSGRSALARCLAYYLGGSVLSTDELMHQFMQQRQDEYLEKIKQQAIAEGISLLNNKRTLEADEREKNRVEQIKEWVRTVTSLLEEMSNLLTEIEKEEKKEKFEISSFPMAMKKVQTTDVFEDSEFAVALSNLREQLQELNVPIYKLDVQTWKSFITERRKLLQYLPHDLMQKSQPKPATVFDEFVKEYVATALANAGLNDLQISGGSILEMFIRHITIAEENYHKQGFGRGGWIIDGMLCNLKILQDFFPDYAGDDIIVLQDSSNFLVENYKGRKSTFFRDFRNFFNSLEMRDAALRSPSSTSTQEYKEDFVKSIVNDILESKHFYDKKGSIEGSESNVDLRVEEYKKDLKTFQRDWADVRKLYLDNNITPIEIDVSGKTLPDIFIDTIKSLESRYTYKAFQMTEDDRAEEVVTFGYEKEQNLSGREDSTPRVSKSANVKQDMRVYGDTLDFCPVTFSENFVLWKGKEDFAVKHNEKVYLLATNSDMQKFLGDPYKFLQQEYSTKVPPPRICVVGVAGCGKTNMSKSLSENYGLIYLSYEMFLKKAFKIVTKETLSEISSRTTKAELRAYLESGTPLRNSIMAKLERYWFEEPFKSKGFVFDDFPKSHHDIDFMVSNKLIPDVILYLHGEEDYLKKKILERQLNLWQVEVDKQRRENEFKHSKALEKWREQRSARFNALIEERRERRYARKLERVPTNLQPESDEIFSELKTTSLVSFDSVADQEDIDEVDKILDSEFPPIVFDVPAPDPHSYISRIEPVIFNLVRENTASIRKIKEKCLIHQVPFVEIPLDFDQMDKTKIASFLIVDPLKFRNLSFLESTWEVSLDIAERLLKCGYLFLSKFGKTCPVQYYERKFPIQMYQVAEDDNNLFPVIHRSYIYFIIGMESKEVFKEDPLKYIRQEFNWPLLRFRVAVTGPPKSGKTTLCNRIQNRFGFKLVTRGSAARYVLKYLVESELGKNMESVLRKGWELTDEMVIRSVEAATFDPRAMAQGVVFDGFPNDVNETKHLAYLDLVPHIIIDLHATQQEVFEHLKFSSPRSVLPKFSHGFTMHLFDKWSSEADYFREWFDKEYQAMTTVPSKASAWSVWHQSEEYLLSIFFEISHYHIHIAYDWPVRLSNMLITPLEFLERQSSFKSFCPVCLHFSNSLSSGGHPPDRTGVVQFRSYFYWICDYHMELFLKSPELYLPPYNRHSMPGNVPKRIVLDRWPENIYEGGSCAVCYKTKRVITKGKLSLCSTFDDKAYLFDSIDCLNKFLRNPQLFLFGIEFHAPVYQDLNYKTLPLLGMLEQYLARHIVQGLSYLAKRRPIIPGLSISSSALIGLGLFIKVKNEKPNRLKSYYEEGFKLYNERREKILGYLELMKTFRNPYLHYEEPLPPFSLPPAPIKSESLITIVSRIVDQCVDNIDIYLQDNNDSSYGSSVD